MSDRQGQDSLPLSRRTLLKATGAGVVGVAGLPAAAAAGGAGGSLIWQFEPGFSAAVISSPTIVGGTVFTGSNFRSHTFALDAVDGTERWESEETGGVGGMASSPAVRDGTVYIGDPGGYIHALDATDGTQRWEYWTGQLSDARQSPTVADGTVFAGGSTGLYALDSADGSVVWEKTGLGALGPSSPTVVDGTVFIGSDEPTFEDFNQAYALDATDGSTIWGFSTDESFNFSAPTVADGTVFIGGRSQLGALYALDAASGTERWSYQTDGAIFSSPTVANGTVFVGSDDNSVYALDTASGEERWTYETGDRVRSSPTVVGETVFIGSNDGSVYALDAADGSLVWEFDTGGSVLSSPTVVDGVVFVGGPDGLYALYGGVDGSSDGTRVTLGTLGHHHTWADEPPQSLLTRISGTVMDAETGDPVPDVDLFLASSDQAHVALGLIEQFPDNAAPAAELEDATTATTDGNGAYALPAIDPGEYCILVVPPADTDYQPTLVSAVTVTRGEDRVEDVELATYPLACLDPTTDQLLVGSRERLDASTATAAEVFLDGAEVLGDQAVDTLGVVDRAVGVNLDASRDQFDDEVAEALRKTGLDWLERGINGVLGQLWEGLDAALQETLSGTSGTLAGEEWFTGVQYDDPETLIEEGYATTPLYADAASTIDSAASSYESLIEDDPAEEFDVDAAKAVLRAVVRQLRSPRHGIPGVVVTPGGSTYKIDQTETYARSYDWTSQRLDEIGTGQTIAQVTQVIGAALMTTGVGTAVGAQLFAASKASQAALEKAEMVALTKLAADWTFTQLHWGLDLGEIGAVTLAVVDWLDAATDEGLAEASLAIESVDMNLDDTVVGPPRATANRPVDPPGWFPIAIQFEAVDTATVEVRNTGSTATAFRVSMYDQYGGGQQVAKRGALVPPADEPPLALDPGESTTVTLEYSAEFDDPLTDHTMTIQAWSDGAIRATESQLFQVETDVTVGGAGAEIRSQELVVTRGDRAHDVPLTAADLDDVRPSVEQSLDDTVTPSNPVVETTHTTAADTRQLEFTLSTPGEVGLQVRDPEGNVVGYDPAAGGARTELPAASYVGPEATPQTATFDATPETEYTVRAVGYRFLTDSPVDVAVQARETPERDAILSVSPDDATAFLTPGATTEFELTVAEIGDQAAVEGVTLDPGRFTDSQGNELSGVTVAPSETGFDVGPGSEKRVILSVETDADVELPGAPEDTRYTGEITVETANAGSVAVTVSALALSTTVEGARLVGGSRTVQGVELAALNPDTFDEPPDSVEPVAAYDLDATGEGVVQLALPRPAGRSRLSVFAVGDAWQEVDTGRVGDRIRLTLDADDPVPALVIGAAGPPPITDDPPQDLNGDGLYEDIDGDGEFTVRDVQVFFQNRDAPAVGNNAEFFNFSGQDPSDVTIADVQALFDDLQASSSDAEVAEEIGTEQSGEQRGH
jgi:outer membrane protein assembly factor BamB